ncbi:hypothetical protein DVF53_24705 [Salmonella enterica subsp. enterica serovar Kottbus]|nr:hypothetical protein [Salmonella enterica subsp. enterica serovar Kottbus]
MYWQSGLSLSVFLALTGPLLFSFFRFDLSVVSTARFLHSHGENRFPEDFDHDDLDVIFCRYSVR